MYNSYIFALTCVMSGLDPFTVYSSHIYIVPTSIGYLHSTFPFFATAALPGTSSRCPCTYVLYFHQGDIRTTHLK
jgi:hypothetical protein